MLIHEFHVAKLRIEMNVYDPTHWLHCEFFSCKTENIERAAAVSVAISSSAQYASFRYQDHLLKRS